MAILKIVNEAGKYHDNRALATVIDYCRKPEKVENGYVGGIACNPLQAVIEMETLASLYNKNDGLRLRHMCLNFEPNELTEPFTAYVIGHQAAMYYGYDYQIFYGVHQDKEHIHIHFVMNTVSYRSGLKYQGTKKDYYDYQNHLRAILSEYGISLMVH